MLALGPNVARADPKSEEACLASHKKTQELELDKKLVAAESEAVVCSQSVCPVEVREMCVDFLRRIRENEPTVVMVLRDSAGKTYSNAKIAIDGRPAPNALDGSATHLDPGQHTVDYQVANASKHSMTILLREGEKDREIVLTLDEPKTKPRFSPVAHLLGGVGAASLAAFAVVGSVALARAHALDKDCGHRCAIERPADVDSVLHEAVAADVCLGAGLTLVAAAGLTMGLTWTNSAPTGAPARATASVAVSPRGLGMNVRF